MYKNVQGKNISQAKALINNSIPAYLSLKEIPTPLKPTEWRSFLYGYDQTKSTFLVQGFEVGFKVRSSF